MIYNPNTHLRRAPDGEYGSDRIAGTLTKGSFVRFDGRDWIIANVSGSAYTLMLKKMTATTTHGPHGPYKGSDLATCCADFQSAMSERALRKVNIKTVCDVTAKVWAPISYDIEDWVSGGTGTGITTWTPNDGIYDTTGYPGYWCANYTGYGDNISPYYVWASGSIIAEANHNQGGCFRPCIEVVQ